MPADDGTDDVLDGEDYPDGKMELFSQFTTFCYYGFTTNILIFDEKTIVNPICFDVFEYYIIFFFHYDILVIL